MKINGQICVMVLVFAIVLNISLLGNSTTPLKLSRLDSNSTQHQYDLIELGQIVTGGVAYGIQVVDNKAYVADGQNGMVIIDVSNPENPQIISSIRDGTGAPEDIYIINDLSFVADGIDGLEIINISDPANPVEMSNFNDGGQAHRVVVIGNYAFVADGEDGLEVIDVSNPENPTEITQYYLTGLYRDIHIVDEMAFIANLVITDGRLQYSDLTIL
ncbi:MAG: LVIVD repeat-containing protein, partial [Candidatus Hodarchaeales archaeon]